jgi:hypothetical protein
MELAWAGAKAELAQSECDRSLISVGDSAALRSLYNDASGGWAAPRLCPWSPREEESVTAKHCCDSHSCLPPLAVQAELNVVTDIAQALKSTFEASLGSRRSRDAGVRCGMRAHACDCVCGGGGLWLARPMLAAQASSWHSGGCPLFPLRWQPEAGRGAPQALFGVVRQGYTLPRPRSTSKVS